MMRKSLRRVLDRLRAATGGMFRKESVHGGLQEPQQLSGHLAPTRTRP